MCSSDLAAFVSREMWARVAPDKDLGKFAIAPRLGRKIWQSVAHVLHIVRPH